MPVVAIGVAGFALASGGAAAIGAVIAGTATLATALTAVAAVGAVVSAVGAVTGDKTLSTVGMVMGGIGGVGALAANAGLLGASATTESLFGSSVMASPASMGGDVASSIDGTMVASGSGADFGATGLINTPVNAPGIDAEAAVGADAAAVPGPTTDVVNTDVIDSLSGSSRSIGSVKNVIDPTTVEGSNFGTPAQDALAKNPTASGGSEVSGTALNDVDLPSPPAVSAPTTGAPQTPSNTSVNAKGLPDVKMPGNTYVGQNGTTYTSDGSRWVAEGTGGISGFLKSSGGGMMAMGALQAGGAFLEGAFDEVKPAQAAAYNAQAAANLAAANLANQQNKNMSAPIPVATRVQPVGRGIINQAVA